MAFLVQSDASRNTRLVTQDGRVLQPEGTVHLARGGYVVGSTDHNRLGQPVLGVHPSQVRRRV